MGHMFRDCGVKPEIECFDTGDLVFAEDLIADGALDGPGMYSIVMGTKYGIHATPEAMIYCKNHLPPGRGLAGLRHQPAHLADGGPVDHPRRQRAHRLRGIHLSRPGQPGAPNAALVAQAVELVERLGAQVASAGEARKQLGLPN